MALKDIYFQDEIPGLFGKINHIIDFAENPCDAPWTIYMEAAVPAVGHFALGLLQIDMVDVVRSYARPRSAVRRSHLRDKSRRRGRFRGIPEPSDLVAEWIPGWDEVKGRHVSDGVKALWIIDGVLQRALFWWMIVDLLSDSLFIWTSLINETEFCKEIAKPKALAMNDDNTTAVTISGWVAAGPLHQQYGEPEIVWNHSTASIPEGWHKLIFGATVAASLNEVTKVQLRWIDPSRSWTVPIYSDVYDFLPGEEKDIICAGLFQGPSAPSIEVICYTGSIKGRNGNCFITRWQ